LIADIPKREITPIRPERKPLLCRRHQIQIAIMIQIRKIDCQQIGKGIQSFRLCFDYQKSLACFRIHLIFKDPDSRFSTHHQIQVGVARW